MVTHAAMERGHGVSDRSNRICDPRPVGFFDFWIPSRGFFSLVCVLDLAALVWPYVASGQRQSQIKNTAPVPRRRID